MKLLIECSTDSQCGGERGNPQAGARNGEPMSRNASELDSASLRCVRVAKLPEMLKPAIGGEETFTSCRQTLRGGWRWRVGKDNSRNLRGPISAKVPGRESDGLIVAKKRLIRVEQRGPTVNVQPSKLCLTVWPKADCGKINEPAAMDAEHTSGMGKFAGEPDAGKLHVRFDEGE